MSESDEKGCLSKTGNCLTREDGEKTSFTDPRKWGLCAKILCGCGTFWAIVVALAAVAFALVVNSYSVAPQPFNPDETDVLTSLSFIKSDVDHVVIDGLPEWRSKWRLPIDLYKLAAIIYEFTSKIDKHEVEILDARELELNYEDTGFTLVDYEFDIEDYSSEEAQEEYREALLDIIVDLHPGVSHVGFSDFIFRDMASTNKPATDLPHLDYFQDTERWLEFVGDTIEENDFTFNYYNVETGEKTKVTPTEKYLREEYGEDIYQLTLGLWKGIEMENPICDIPLAVVDARTFREEDLLESRQYNLMYETPSGKIQGFNNLGGVPRYHEDQKWYYYSMMDTDEVLVFRHKTEDDFHANLHVAFRNPNCPEHYQSRRSVEARAWLIFESEDDA